MKNFEHYEKWPIQTLVYLRCVLLIRKQEISRDMGRDPLLSKEIMMCFSFDIHDALKQNANYNFLKFYDIVTPYLDKLISDKFNKLKDNRRCEDMRKVDNLLSLAPSEIIGTWWEEATVRHHNTLKKIQENTPAIVIYRNGKPQNCHPPDEYPALKILSNLDLLLTAYR